ELRVEIGKGTDRTSVRRAERRAKAAEAEVRARQKTFAEVAYLAHETKAGGFKNAKHAAQWITTLETYAFPTLGEKSVAEIRAGDVVETLKPIWHEIPETASRVAQRIGAVMRYAEAHGSDRVAYLAHETKAGGFKNAKHAAQWITTLETYAFPTLGEKSVAEIRAGDVVETLKPIWHEIPETASRVAQRIGAVMRYAEAHG